MKYPETYNSWVKKVWNGNTEMSDAICYEKRIVVERKGKN